MANKKISALTSATTPLAGTEVLPIVQSSATVKVSAANITAGRAVDTLQVTSTGPNGIPITLQEITAAPSSATAAYVGVSTSAFPGGANGDLILIPRTSAANDVRIYVGSGTPTETLVIQGSTKDIRFTSGNLVPTTAAKGINFTANSAAAGKTSQLLNWYEEGTFTPVVADATTGGNTGTAALAKGRYTRVGRLITVTIAFLDITTTGMTAGNTLYIRGLPYTSITDAYVNFQGSQSNSQLASTNGAIYPTLGNNSSVIYLLDGVAAGSGTTLKVSAITSGQTDLYITLTYEAA